MKKDMLIVVPYRNREAHLEKFIKKTPEYFNKQPITYDILICELDQDCSWNAGLPCNSLIDFITDKEYEWLYVHHVDVTPVEGEWKFPKDNEIYHNLGDYGSCLMRMKDFLKVGGYSNSFWGWGAEDNDLYSRLRASGYEVTALNESYSVKFDTEYQSHERAFDGINYANSIRILYSPLDRDKTNIFNYQEHAYTKSPIRISENIYRQVVVPKTICPKKYKSSNVLISYLKNYTDPKVLMPFIKSAMIYSGFSYDVAICIADSNPSKYLIEQIEAFGAKVFLHNQMHENLFIDRYFAYLNFLDQNPQYEKILHVDCLDAIFQSNPFDHIGDELVISSEELPLEKESWNTRTFKGIYPEPIYESLKDKDIVCGGVIGGPKQKFINLCNFFFEEVEKVSIPRNEGYDQPILQKIIYQDNLHIEIKQLKDAFCCNLHVFKAYNNLFKDRIFVTNDTTFTNLHNVKFSIVHQYNRLDKSYLKIYKHFNDFYAPL